MNQSQLKAVKSYIEDNLQVYSLDGLYKVKESCENSLVVVPLRGTTFSFVALDIVLRARCLFKVQCHAACFSSDCTVYLELY